MSGTEETYHYTKEDVRKLEARESKLHGGNVPADSEVSHLKSTIDSKSNPEVISERQANLPLPDQPPTASDWNSADQRTVNVGSGGVQSDVSTGKGLREPVTGDSSVRVSGDEWKTNTAPDSGVGRQGKDGLQGLPSDAVTRDAKNKV
ncbi:MAG: hypothetical protein M1833_001149 [Piccolia ochrophora]|nr:MAG: hypothetical protein M1833_001149 [Piccolia ochrophora]